MISPMTRYSFILLNGEQDGLLEQLQEMGLVDITRSARPVDEKSRRLMSDVELLDGLIKGIRAADIPEGTAVQPLLGGDSLSDAAGDILYRESVDGVQVSFALGIGVGFRLTDHVSLYFDPSLRYYLENGQPKSIRTAQPLMMSVEAGLRFDL